MNKVVIMWCWWFELTSHAVGHFVPTHLHDMKPTVLLNSCKTPPQPWQDTLQWAEQSNRTRTFVPGFYLR